MLLWKAGLVRAWWVRIFDELLSTNSVKTYSNIADSLRKWTTSGALGGEPTVTKVADAVRTIAKEMRWDRNNYCLG